MARKSFETIELGEAAVVPAPDGSRVRILPALAGGSMAHFTLEPGKVSIAVRHRSVEEIWFITGGRGEMWRADAAGEEVTPVTEGVALTIPLGTSFQFRTAGSSPLTAVAITMPPWPGEGEAETVCGPWQPVL